jgi:hypothetical protein
MYVGAADPEGNTTWQLQVWQFVVHDAQPKVHCLEALVMWGM